MTTGQIYLSTDEVRRLFNYSTPEGTIDCMHRHGLTALRAGRRYLWRRIDVEALIAKLETNARAHAGDP